MSENEHLTDPVVPEYVAPEHVEEQDKEASRPSKKSKKSAWDDKLLDKEFIQCYDPDEAFLECKLCNKKLQSRRSFNKER